MHSRRFLSITLLSVTAMSALAQGNVSSKPALTSPQLDHAAQPPASIEVAGAIAATLTAEDLATWLDGYMPYALKTGDIAGAVVVVARDGQILVERGYGYSDVARRTPVDPKRTLFRQGSVSKLFTWTAVMQLVERGKINLDTDINHYLDFKIPSRDGQPVTLRNLMQHTGGFEEYAKGLASDDPKTALSTETRLKRWTPERIFPPGTTPAYSNYGAALAGYIVQRVSGEPFDAYIARHVLAPLEMPYSTFRQPLPATLAPWMSKGYSVASQDNRNAVKGIPRSANGATGDPKGFEILDPPAGALSSTGEDMAHFMIAHLQDGAYRDARILQPATAQRMHDSPLTLLPPLNRMELGFYETNINHREVIGHLGDTQYFHTALHLFLKEHVGFYVSFNSQGEGGAALELRGALFEDFADRYFPDTGQDGPGIEQAGGVAPDTAAQHARMLAGTWVLSRRFESNFANVTELLGQVTIRVGPKGELVWPHLGLNDPPRHWIETAPFVWRDTGSHRWLAAKVVDNQVVRWSLDAFSAYAVFDRVPWYKNSTWLLPLLYASIAALASTLILWPIRAIIRRYYGATLALEPRTRAFRLSRIAAAVMVAAVAGWTVTLAILSADLENMASRFDPVLWAIEIGGSIAFVGCCTGMLWNLWVVWTGPRRWAARIWSIVLALSSLIVLWIAIAFRLLSFGVNY
jgi:CubicO group peptidase (beta-lactamase class C family)